MKDCNGNPIGVGDTVKSSVGTTYVVSRLDAGIGTVHVRDVGTANELPIQFAPDMLLVVRHAPPPIKAGDLVEWHGHDYVMRGTAAAVFDRQDWCREPSSHVTSDLVKTSDLRRVEAPAPSAPPESFFRVGDKVWVERWNNGPWIRGAVVHVREDRLVVDPRPNRLDIWRIACGDAQAALRLCEYKRGEEVEFKEWKDGPWLPGFVVTTGAMNVWLRVRHENGFIDDHYVDSALLVRRARISQEAMNDLGVGTVPGEDRLAGISPNTVFCDVQVGALVCLERADSIVAGIKQDDDTAITREGVRERVMPGEMVYEGETNRLFWCLAGCNACKGGELKRAVHAEVYRCHSCGGTWHHDDLLRRRGQEMTQEWARRSEMGKKLRHKLATKKERA